MIRATKKDLSWFDLDNYDFINKLTLSEFIQELEWRDLLYQAFSDDSGIFAGENNIKYQRIFAGDPHLEALNEEEKEINEYIQQINDEAPSLWNEHGDLPSLPSALGVSPVSFTALSMYGFTAIDQGFFKRDDEYFYIRPEAMLASVSGNLADCLEDTALVSIDLNDATDEEILASMAKLLPKWREQLALPEQPHVAQKRIGLKTLQKLISNRVLPIIDLLIWEAYSSKEVTNPMIALLVFNDDPKDTQAIKDTIKPFALEVMSERYTRLLRLHASKDGEIYSVKMGDLMSRIL